VYDDDGAAWFSLVVCVVVCCRIWLRSALRSREFVSGWRLRLANFLSAMEFRSSFRYAPRHS